VDILFFNRVPKVGSTSIQSLLGRLSSENGFKLVRDTMNQVEMVTMDRKGQEELANRVMAHPEGSVFSKHVAWVDFAALGHPSPIYVNLVRDPVERLVSWFYYIRAAWYILDRKQAFPNNPLPSSSWVRKTFDSCVADPRDMECKYPQGNFGGFEDHRRQSIFFCGHHRDCVPFNSERANQLAKRVVEEHYAVVGVLEEMNKTLAVLEAFMPRHFRGAREAYWSYASEVNRNKLRPSVSEETRLIVGRNLTQETDFYLWCKQRLNTMYYALVREGRLYLEDSVR